MLRYQCENKIFTLKFVLTPKLVMRKVQRKNGEYYEKVTGLFKRL